MGSNHRASYLPQYSLGLLSIQHKAHRFSPVEIAVLAVQISQSVKHKDEDLSSDPQNPCKKLGIVVHTCNPNTVEAEIEGSLGLPSQSVQLNQ